MEKDSKIYVAGHTGLFGSAIVRELTKRGFGNIICRTHAELELTNQLAVQNFFNIEKPDYVFMMCGKVGGIKANAEYMAAFTMENAQMNLNIIDAAHKIGVKKLLYPGSSCMYPKNSSQPVREEYLLQGELEPTNEGYALAKILGLKLCIYYRKQYGDNFITCIPANLYGIGDDFDEGNNHVVPALIKRFHRAKLNGEKKVSVWGSGKPRRDFLYIDDAAEACVELMEGYNEAFPINISTGHSESISDLARLTANVIGYNGQIVFDTTKPDGMMLRTLSNEQISKLNWQAKTTLAEGLKKTYQWYLQQGEKND